MPILPEFYDGEFDYLQTHKALQESILRDIIRRILKTDITITDTAAWQTEKLQQSGMLFDEIVVKVSEAAKGTEKEIRQIFDDAKTEVFNYEDEELILAGYEPEKVKNVSPSMQKTINSALKKTSTEAKNLTKTTAITSQYAYIQSADLAHMQVASGAFSYQDAIKNAIRNAAGMGTSVLYPSGHKSTLDAAVRRAVLTGVNQTAVQLQNERADELSCDLMEITAHMGARPEHAVWQGQIVSRSGRQGYFSLADIGYGDVRGFMGANCRHNWFMFFEGISKRAYSDAELKKMSEGTVEYNGEKIGVYEATQRQRGYERSIKKTKGELVALDEQIKNTKDDAEKLSLKAEFERQAVLLKGQEAKLSDFCKKTDLVRDRYREQVFSKETENGLRNFGKSTSQKAVMSAKKHYEDFVAVLGKENAPASLDKYYDLKYNNPEEFKKLKYEYKTRYYLQNDANKTIIDSKQGRHILGHPRYISGRSYLVVDSEEAQIIINNNAGHGMLNDTFSVPYFGKETVVSDKIFGVNINQVHNHKTLTDTAKIHYSKKGTHIVPRANDVKNQTVTQLKLTAKKYAMVYYDTPEYIVNVLGGKPLTAQEKEFRINSLLSGKQSKTSLIKDIKAMEKKILKSRGDI